MGIRIDKVNQQLKREISLIIQQDLEDPRLAFITVIEVDTSKDLRHAKVKYSVLGQEKDKENAANALQSARGFIRREIGHRLNLRYTPELNFIFDDSVQFSARIEETLQELQDEQN